MIQHGGLKELHAAGVPILAGTDIGYSDAPPLHAELEIMVKDGGFMPLEALATATGNPAKVYPMLADRGRIALGMRADLLLLDCHPTKDILVARKVVTIWRAGFEVNRAAWKPELTAPKLSKGGPGGPPRGAGSADAAPAGTRPPAGPTAYVTDDEE